ncbi:MAG: hypothetical protein ACREQ4_03170 [Candidatus Binataceae bacterium]
MAGHRSITRQCAAIVIAMAASVLFSPRSAWPGSTGVGVVQGKVNDANKATGGPRALSKNLLVNGDLSRGSGEAPDEWRHDGWILSPAATTFTWTAPRNGQPGELGIVNHQENDARWVQSLSLRPGWYYLSVEARSKEVFGVKTGVNISVLEDGIVSNTLLGTSEWQRVALYLEVGKGGADVDVALRVGGFASVARGEAAFRDPRVVRITGPPPSGTPFVYNLTAVRRAEGSGPIGRLWTLVATFLGFLLLAVIGWWLYGTSIPAAGEIRKSSRAKRRRPRLEVERQGGHEATGPTRRRVRR